MPHVEKTVSAANALFHRTDGRAESDGRQRRWHLRQRHWQHERPRNRKAPTSDGDEVRTGDQEIKEFGARSREIIGALIDVHRAPGPGLLESAYEACVCRELEIRRIRFERQRPVGIVYKGLNVECGYRIDVLVEARLVLELKCVEKLLPVHSAQTLTYMKLSA